MSHLSYFAHNKLFFVPFCFGIDKLWTYLWKLIYNQTNKKLSIEVPRVPLFVKGNLIQNRKSHRFCKEIVWIQQIHLSYNSIAIYILNLKDKEGFMALVFTWYIYFHFDSINSILINYPMWGKYIYRFICLDATFYLPYVYTVKFDHRLLLTQLFNIIYLHAFSSRVFSQMINIGKQTEAISKIYPFINNDNDVIFEYLPICLSHSCRRFSLHIPISLSISLSISSCMYVQLTNTYKTSSDKMFISKLWIRLLLNKYSANVTAILVLFLRQMRGANDENSQRFI